MCSALVVSNRACGSSAMPTSRARRLNPAPPARWRVWPVHWRALRVTGTARPLVFHKADLERPFLTHNADLLAMVGPQLEAELSQALAQKAIGEQVKGILKRLLAGKRPGMEDVARELHLSSRTLQRRLAEEGATFQRLVQEARRELARHYLLHSSLELNETAYLLGYEDANSFFRAFRHWEGSSPGDCAPIRRTASRSLRGGLRPRPSRQRFPQSPIDRRISACKKERGPATRSGGDLAGR
jgi:AraC-like DNA-binding protein